MNQKYIVMAVIGFVAWFSWFFRYDPAEGRAVLDRWTGEMIYPVTSTRYDLSTMEE